MDNFVQGDVVKMKSGGTVMTVLRLVGSSKFDNEYDNNGKLLKRQIKNTSSNVYGQESEYSEDLCYYDKDDSLLSIMCYKIQDGQKTLFSEEYFSMSMTDNR